MISHVSLDYQTIGVLTAVIAAVTAMSKLLIDALSQRRVHNAETTLKILDEFHGQRIRNARRRATEAIQQPDTEQTPDDLLDFFDTVGMLLKRRALDDQMLWSILNYWVSRYWCACERYIRQKQQADKALWEDFEYLRIRLAKVHKRRHRGRNQPDGDPCLPQELDRFLSEEARINIDNDA